MTAANPLSALGRILVATDFSAAAGAAVSRAGQLAAAHRAELHLLHATPDWTLFSHRVAARQQHYEEVSRNAEAMMNREVDRVRSTFGISPRGRVQLGTATGTVTRMIETIRPHLFVIGAQGEHGSRFAPSALGGTTLKLITQITAPVLLVRDTGADPYRVSLAAVREPDEQAARIVRLAALLTAGGRCHVVRAYEVPYVERLRLSSVSDSEVTACGEAARTAAMPMMQGLVSAAAGTQVEVHLERGMPLPTILTEVTRFGPQFVAVGRHVGHPGESAHAIVGCVGVRLAYHCPVDVLLVP